MSRLHRPLLKLGHHMSGKSGNGSSPLAPTAQVELANVGYGATVHAQSKAGQGERTLPRFGEAHMKITAAVVPAPSTPFEIDTLDLAGPLADEVLVRVVASGICPTDLHAPRWLFPKPAVPGGLRP
jgi:hypothetical protein